MNASIRNLRNDPATDRSEWAMNGLKYHTAITNILNELRKEIKYCDDKKISHTDFRDMILRELNDLEIAHDF